jgi:hypothetical protein
MKYLYFLFFILIVSCSVTKKTYMCADRPCVDKKEFNDFFAKNLTIEIQKKIKKKNPSVDLIRLNTGEKKVQKMNVTSGSDYEKLKKKEKKLIIKAERARLKNERKIKKILERKQTKEKKRLAKLTKNNYKKNIKIKAEKDNIVNPSLIQTKSATTSPAKTKELNVKKKKKSEEFEISLSLNQTGICKDIKDCDIEKIAEMLIEQGQKKNFPDITSN